MIVYADKVMADDSGDFDGCGALRREIFLTFGSHTMSTLVSWSNDQAIVIFSHYYPYTHDTIDIPSVISLATRHYFSLFNNPSSGGNPTASTQPKSAIIFA